MRKRRTAILTSAIILIGIVYVSPFFFLIMNTFKTYGEIIGSFISLPRRINLENYITVWRIMHFPKVFLNSIIICCFTVLGTIFVTSLAGYRLQRHRNRFTKGVYFYFIVGMIVPFHSIMIPLLQTVKQYGMINSRAGIILVYIALFCSFGIFVYYGFIKTIPLELEDAAQVDGCGRIGIFFRIVFPLLSPATITLMILFFMWSWNDFILPYLMLDRRELQTVTQNVYIFVGFYTIDWNHFVTSVAISSSPLIIMYALAQKHIVKGISLGALKG